MSRARVAVALACVAVLSACAHDAPTGADEPLPPPSIGVLPTVEAGAVLTLPLAAYVANAEELATLSQARGLLEQDCMRRLGFTEWQPPAPSEIEVTDSGLKIGIVDRERAAQYGYHDPRQVGMQRDTTPMTPDERAEVAALSGYDVAGSLSEVEVPDGGCTGEAGRRLREGEPAHDPELYGRLFSQSNEATETDPRVVAALEAWRECMATINHSYRNPWEAAGQSWSRPDAPPTQAEIALATADVDCKHQTDLPGIWLAVLGGYQHELIERNSAELEAVRAAIDFQLTRAESVLAGRG